MPGNTTFRTPRTSSWPPSAADPRPPA